MRRNMRALIIFIMFLLASGSACPSLRAESGTSPDPTGQLKPFIAEVVAILTDASLQGDKHRQERRTKVMNVAHERFDFTEMSKRVLGKQWDKLSADEKKYFVELFTKLLEHAYLGKIEDYSGQKVEFVGQRIKDDRAQVQTTLVDKDVTMQVHYIMILKGQEWMVYDIVVEGVSIIRNYMDQFREILRQENYAGLLKQLEDKLATLEEGKS